MFPPITVSLQNIDLTMDWRTYLLTNSPFDANQSDYCLGILSTGPTGFTIIGDTTMQNYYVIFDRTNTQIGWANVNRDNCGALPYQRNA